MSTVITQYLQAVQADWIVIKTLGYRVAVYIFLWPEFWPELHSPAFWTSRKSGKNNYRVSGLSRGG
jgi:hypothetical protein